jgi:hypothetical protein
MLVRSDPANANVQIFNGENTGGGVAGDASLSSLTGPVDIDIVLDTSAATWTASYFVNGVQQGATQNLPASAMTEIGGIGFSRTSSAGDTGGGTIDNFSLTQTQVPEPACSAVAGLTLLLLGGRRRRLA